MMNHLARSELFRAAIAKPTFLPEMKRPCRSVEKESAEANAKAILDKTCAELRLKPNG